MPSSSFPITTTTTTTTAMYSSNNQSIPTSMPYDHAYSSHPRYGYVPQARRESREQYAQQNMQHVPQPRRGSREQYAQEVVEPRSREREQYVQQNSQDVPQARRISREQFIQQNAQEVYEPRRRERERFVREGAEDVPSPAPLRLSRQPAQSVKPARGQITMREVFGGAPPPTYTATPHTGMSALQDDNYGRNEQMPILKHWQLQSQPQPAPMLPPPVPVHRHNPSLGRSPLRNMFTPPEPHHQNSSRNTCAEQLNSNHPNVILTEYTEQIPVEGKKKNSLTRSVSKKVSQMVTSLSEGLSRKSRSKDSKESLGRLSQKSLEKVSFFFKKSPPPTYNSLPKPIELDLLPPPLQLRRKLSTITPSQNSAMGSEGSGEFKSRYDKYPGEFGHPRDFVPMLGTPKLPEPEGWGSCQFYEMYEPKDKARMEIWMRSLINADCPGFTYLYLDNNLNGVKDPDDEGIWGR